MGVKKVAEAVVWMLFAVYAIWSAIHHLRAGEDVWAALMLFTAAMAFLNLRDCR